VREHNRRKTFSSQPPRELLRRAIQYLRGACDVWSTMYLKNLTSWFKCFDSCRLRVTGLRSGWLWLSEWSLSASEELIRGANWCCCKLQVPIDLPWNSKMGIMRYSISTPINIFACSMSFIDHRGFVSAMDSHTLKSSQQKRVWQRPSSWRWWENSASLQTSSTDKLTGELNHHE
jgi:hypothetical protein